MIKSIVILAIAASLSACAAPQREVLPTVYEKSVPVAQVSKYSLDEAECRAEQEKAMPRRYVKNVAHGAAYDVEQQQDKQAEDLMRNCLAKRGYVGVAN